MAVTDADDDHDIDDVDNGHLCDRWMLVAGWIGNCWICTKYGECEITNNKFAKYLIKRNISSWSFEDRRKKAQIKKQFPKNVSDKENRVPALPAEQQYPTAELLTDAIISGTTRVLEMLFLSGGSAQWAVEKNLLNKL